MQIKQAIDTPFGINVFGSATIRVAPDIAALRFSVSRLAKTPKEAFEVAHTAAQNTREFLNKLAADDVGMSRVTLDQSWESRPVYSNFIGYTARISFHVLLRDLNRLEDILVGVVDAGTNEIGSILLQTSELKEVRAEARGRAVGAAREKAEIYCKAANVSLGPVIHIEDVSPDAIRRQSFHTTMESPSDDEEPSHAFDPESIEVAAAVMLSFKLGQ